MKVCEKSPDAFQLRRHGGDPRRRRTVAQTFVAEEAEELAALPDRAAERPAELIALELGALDPGAVVEEAVGVEVVIAQVLEGRPVKFLRAALGREVDDARRRSGRTARHRRCG